MKSGEATMGTLSKEQLEKIVMILNDNAGQKDIDHIVQLDLSRRVVEVKLRTARPYAESWEWIEQYFISPLGWVTVGTTEYLGSGGPILGYDVIVSGADGRV